MPGMTLRIFNCTHCQQPFTLMEGDMLVPMPRLCDTCLKSFWETSLDELHTLGMAEGNIQLLQSLKSAHTLEDLLGERVRAREQG